MTGTRPAAVNPPLVGIYRIDPAHSTIAFTTRHLFGLGVVRGSFAVQDGEIRSADGPELRLRAHARADRYDLGVTAARGMAARHLDLDLDILAVRSDGQDGRWSS